MKTVLFILVRAFEVRIHTVGGGHCTQDEDRRSSCNHVEPFCEALGLTPQVWLLIRLANTD
jgi:hypothetical protein